MIKTPLPKSIYISCVPFIQTWAFFESILMPSIRNSVSMPLNLNFECNEIMNGPKSGRLIEIYPFPTGNQTTKVSSKRKLVIWLRALRDFGAQKQTTSTQPITVLDDCSYQSTIPEGQCQSCHRRAMQHSLYFTQEKCTRSAKKRLENLPISSSYFLVSQDQRNIISPNYAFFDARSNGTKYMTARCLPQLKNPKN